MNCPIITHKRVFCQAQNQVLIHGIDGKKQGAQAQYLTGGFAESLSFA